MKTCEEYVLNELENAKKEIESLKEELRKAKNENTYLGGQIIDYQEKLALAVNVARLFELEVTNEKYYDIRFDGHYIGLAQISGVNNDPTEQLVMDFVKAYKDE